MSPIHEPGMNSFNHYAFGCVGEWLFRFAAGIEELELRFRSIRIKLHLDGLDFVRASYQSVRGVIAVEWRKENGKVFLSVTVLANTTALIYMPAKDAGGVTESSKLATQSEGVRFVGVENRYTVFEVLSGRYLFSGQQWRIRVECLQRAFRTSSGAPSFHGRRG